MKKAFVAFAECRWDNSKKWYTPEKLALYSRHLDEAKKNTMATISRSTRESQVSAIQQRRNDG
jgi:hypothetical protein